MKLSANVDNGPRKRRLHFGEVPDCGGILSTFDLPEIIGQDSWVTVARRPDLQTGPDGPGLSRPPSVSGAGVGRVYK